MSSAGALVPGGVLLSTLIAASARAETPRVRVALDDASLPPRSAQLLGTSCSFCTALMARRVVQEGVDYAYVGRLQPSVSVSVSVSVSAPASVACAFSLGEQGDTCVVATDFVEGFFVGGLVDGLDDGAELKLEGRILSLDGLRYVVLTALEPSTG